MLACEYSIEVLLKLVIEEWCRQKSHQPTFGWTTHTLTPMAPLKLGVLGFHCLLEKLTLHHTIPTFNDTEKEAF